MFFFKKILLTFIIFPLFSFSLEIEGKVLISTKIALLIEKDFEKIGFVYKKDTIFFNFSNYKDLTPFDFVKIEYEKIKGINYIDKIFKKAELNFVQNFYIDLNLENLKNYTLVDCRSLKEYSFLKIPGAINLKDLKELKKDKFYVFYGENSQDERVFENFKVFLNKGFENIGIYKGGIRDWHFKGNYFETSPNFIKDYQGRDIIFLFSDKIKEKKFKENSFYFNLEKMEWEDYSNENGLPKIILIGLNEKDKDPYFAAEKILKWRYSSSVPLDGPLSILKGGYEKIKNLELFEGEIKYFEKSFGLEEGEIFYNNFFEIYSQKERDYILVDLRFENFNLNNVLWISMDNLKEEIEKIPKDKKSLLFCYEGKLSKIAYFILKPLGYNVYFTKGSIF